MPAQAVPCGVQGGGTWEWYIGTQSQSLWGQVLTQNLGYNLGGNYSICTDLPDRELPQESQLLGTRAKQMPSKSFWT